MGLSICMHFVYMVCSWLCVLHFVCLVRVNASCVRTESVSGVQKQSKSAFLYLACTLLVFV